VNEILETTEVKKRVHFELMNILFRQIKHMLWAEALAATIVLSILWFQGNKALLLGWYGFMIIITGLPRCYLAYSYARASLRNKQSSRWETQLTGLLFITGLGWGFAGTVLLPTDNNLNQVIIICLLIGVAAAANPFYSPIKKIYATFLVPTLFFSVIVLITKGTNLYIFSGVALFAFGDLMLIISIISSTLIAKTLSLSIQNMELTSNLLKINNILESRASHDTLTELPNRQSFNENLTLAISDARKREKKLALMFLDLDKFKEVNDTFGHDYGDMLLIIIAQRIQQNIRMTDMAGRLGGDEFMILLEDIDTDTENTIVPSLAENICRSIAEPIHIQDKIITITASIGISVYPNDSSDEKTLIKCADIAMYISKNVEGGKYKFYDEISQKI
jgi:diguanylate cyclase (GGDEF)-like protein